MKLSYIALATAVAGATPAAAGYTPLQPAEPGAQPKLQAISIDQPALPRSLALRGMGGACDIVLDIMPNGRVKGVSVRTCTAPELMRPAKIAAYSLRYPRREAAAGPVRGHHITLEWTAPYEDARR